MMEHVGYRLPQQLFDPLLVLLVDRRLPLNVVYQQVGRIIQDVLVRVGQENVRPGSRLFALVPLKMKQNTRYSIHKIQDKNYLKVKGMEIIIMTTNHKKIKNLFQA